MIDKAGRITEAAEAVAIFQRHCGTSDEHAIADLICDLGHLAEERDLDFIDEVKRGIGHWYAERHASNRDRLDRMPRSRSLLRRGSPKRSKLDVATVKPPPVVSAQSTTHRQHQPSSY